MLMHVGRAAHGPHGLPLYPRVIGKTGRRAGEENTDPPVPPGGGAGESRRKDAGAAHACQPTASKHAQHPHPTRREPPTEEPGRFRFLRSVGAQFGYSLRKFLGSRPTRGPNCTIYGTMAQRPPKLGAPKGSDGNWIKQRRTRGSRPEKGPRGNFDNFDGREWIPTEGRVYCIQGP